MRQIDFQKNPNNVLPDILNFRDIGGVISDDTNLYVGRGSVFRSGRLSDLVENDLRLLDELGIISIFDLRARREREADPTIWQGHGVETHVFRPGHKRRLVDMAQDYPATPAGAEALMRDFYADLPRTMAHVFGELLVRISQGAFPCIIHCSAGKDRTGMAVALLLAALGCGREVIVADYVASAHARRIEGAMVRSVVRDESVARFRTRYPADALAVMTDARSDFILSALDAIDRDWGGMAPYLDSIGVTAPVIARLRANLLENREGERL